MLRELSDIKGSAIAASDGLIGTISDCLIDDETWLIRWLVIDPGLWRGGRKVLLPPSALSHVSHIARQFTVRLTRAEVEASPDVNTDLPMSRRMEHLVYDYYGWSPYWWSTGFYLGGYGSDVRAHAPPLAMNAPAPADEKAGAGHVHGDTRLHSAAEMHGFRLQALDGAIGRVTDLLIEDGDWSVHYLVADTHDWWPGRDVLISPRSVDRIALTEGRVEISLDRQAIKDCPAYEPGSPPDRDWESRFHRHLDQNQVQVSST